MARIRDPKLRLTLLIIFLAFITWPITWPITLIAVIILLIRKTPISDFFRKREVVTISTGVVLVEDITLTEEQRKFFDQIESSSEHFFITGEAGTGKSVLLQYLKYKSKKRLVVGAFTGIAALHVGGQTLHTLFGFPLNFVSVNKFKVSSQVAALLGNIDALVIDEVSMVRTDMMDAIDVALRQSKNNIHVPFGGVQLIMFGDVYQLPPVITSYSLRNYFFKQYGGPYFFNSQVWKHTKLNIFELTQSIRQKDDFEFKELLNRIRKNEVDGELLLKLNQRNITPPSDMIVTLAARNDVVDRINMFYLSKIDSSSYEYNADFFGSMSKNIIRVEKVLTLKVGAQVVFLKNDTDGRWVNGTIGIVTSLDDDEIQVMVGGENGNDVYSVPKVTWNNVRYQYNEETEKIVENVIGSFTQFPLRLAWAMTIHKSQGQTYNSVIVDMQGGAFENGQTYVALSRCTSLNGLYLSQPIRKEDIIVDPVVVEFMKNVTVQTFDTLQMPHDIIFPYHNQ